MKLKISPLHILLAIIVAASWGLNFVFTKIALEIFSVYNLLFIRFLFLSIILFPIFPKIPIKLSKLLLITLIFTVGHLGAMNLGLKIGLNSSIAALVQKIDIPFLILLSIIFFQERVSKKLVLGIIIASIGIFILLGAPNAVDNKLAFLLLLLSAFFWSIYSILLKTVKNVNPMALTSWICILSTPLTALLVIFNPETSLFENINILANISFRHLLSLIFVCIFPSLLGHAIWCYLLNKNNASDVAPFILLVPFFGVLGSVIFSNENLSLQLIIGGSLIIIGIALDILKSKGKIVEQKQDFE